MSSRKVKTQAKNTEHPAAQSPAPDPRLSTLDGHPSRVQIELENRFDNSLNGFQGFDPLARNGQPGTGWVNAVTGMGTLSDKTAQGQFHGYNPTDLITLSNLYHGDDLSARILDMPGNEELRLSFKLTTGDANVDEYLSDLVETLETREHFLASRRWARLFGGSWIILGCEDGLPASEPLRPERATKGIEWLRTVDRRFMWPVRYYQDGPKKGSPDLYIVSQAYAGVAEGAYLIHESRMIGFPGAPTGIREKNLNASYDYSVLDKIWPQLRMHAVIWKGIEILITEGPPAVYKVIGLAEKMLAPGGEDALRKRFMMVEYMRSVLHAVIIDPEESFERQPMQISGLNEIISEANIRLASSAECPAMVLFGQDPSGLNASGSSSLRWWQDTRASAQKNIIGPRLQRLGRIALIAAGKPELARKLRVEFEPLYTPTALERAQERAAIANADKTYVDSQVFLPEEIALSRVRSGEWSNGWEGVQNGTREGMLAKIVEQVSNGIEDPEPPEVGQGLAGKEGQEVAK